MRSLRHPGRWILRSAVADSSAARSVVRTYPEYANYAQRTKRLIPWVF